MNPKNTTQVVSSTDDDRCEDVDLLHSAVLNRCLFAQLISSLLKDKIDKVQDRSQAIKHCDF